DHPVTVGKLHHGGVIALELGLTGDVAPPAEHRVEDTDRARPEDIRRGGEGMMHPGDAAKSEQEGRDRADDRPGARVDEMVVVMRFGVCVGHLYGSPLRSSRPVFTSQPRPGASAPAPSPTGFAGSRTGYIV